MPPITPNVYVDTGFSTPPVMRGCNTGFVVTSEGIVLIDPPMYPTYSLRWRDEIARKGEVRYIINTGHHPDHITGNYFFPGTVISHQGIREKFTATLEKMRPSLESGVAPPASMGLRERILHRFQEIDPEGLSLAENYQPRPPTITFSERLTLHLGNHTFELVHLPGHTQYEVAVYVPQERVVFTGDNFTNGWQSNMSVCCPREWIKSLAILETMEVDFIVPGHGEVGDKAALRACAVFVQRTIDTVSEAIRQGLSNEAAVDRISFAGWLPEIHPGADQQRRNVMRLYDMLKNTITF